jgi:hypothetical protein
LYVSFSPVRAACPPILYLIAILIFGISPNPSSWEKNISAIFCTGTQRNLKSYKLNLKIFCGFTAISSSYVKGKLQNQNWLHKNRYITSGRMNKYQVNRNGTRLFTALSPH